MISSQLIVTLYFYFAFLCVTPWLFNWAMRGTMPITTRLLALLIFSVFIVESLFSVWSVYDMAPDRVEEAARLVSPIILFSCFGGYFVVESLVKIVKASQQDNDKTD
jgi:hypothetical protein